MSNEPRIDPQPISEAVAAFRASLRGALLQPGDDAFDATRVIWNGMIDRRPALIARCHGVADVIASVNFARAHGFLVWCAPVVTTSRAMRSATAA